MAERDQYRPGRRGRPWTVLALAALVVAIIVGVGLGIGFDSTGRASSQPSGFAWLRSAPPPASWARIAVPGGLGAVAVPPGFAALDPRTVDPGTVALARLSPGGAYLGYLDVTPRQGAEQLRGWAQFRLAHIRGDTASTAHLDAAVEAARTDGSDRSCVIDDYVTRVGQHAYREIACLVVTGAKASVVVAATPPGDPAGVWMDLERVVAAYPSA